VGANATTRTVLHDAALADGRSDKLTVGVSVSMVDGRIEWIRTADEADLHGATVIDCGGATIVPGLVDGHSHLVLPGGSRWIERGADPREVLHQVALDNARRLVNAGTLWAIDVGAPAPHRDLVLAVREELRGKPGQPYVVSSGGLIAGPGYIKNWTIDADNGDALLRLAMHQLDTGSDFVKLILDMPPRWSNLPGSPFTKDEVRKTVDAVHARGALVTAHSTMPDGARVAAEAGVDSIQHGFQIDDETARIMARNSVALVTTLSVYASRLSFATTTRIEMFHSDAGRSQIQARFERAKESVRAAKRAGVTIAAGSDFGGGSVRAGHLAWEVELLVEAGLEPSDALAAATWRGGDVAGQPFAGRIEPGMSADLFMVHGDPLCDPRALWRVFAVYHQGKRVA
jgi:imidazolonepropionase-like amidohydrolase